jgi:hypothetical protein
MVGDFMVAESSGMDADPIHPQSSHLLRVILSGDTGVG